MEDLIALGIGQTMVIDTDGIMYGPFEDDIDAEEQMAMLHEQGIHSTVLQAVGRA